LLAGVGGGWRGLLHSGSRPVGLPAESSRLKHRAAGHLGPEPTRLITELMQRDRRGTRVERVAFAWEKGEDSGAVRTKVRQRGMPNNHPV